jgi:hypothetical protein
VTARFRILGTDLPGRGCGANTGIEVGVQRGREAVDLVAGDAAGARWEFEVDVRDGRFTGPYVHGRGDERFLYLVWVAEPDRTMFRRAKLWLDPVDATHADGSEVEARLSLRDDAGQPVCASVRPPRIAWSVTAPR